jgi:hypothetical protein
MSPDVATELTEVLDLNLACDYLIEMGEEVDDEWELIDARKVDYDTEAITGRPMWTFAEVPSGKPQAKSEQDNASSRCATPICPK